MDSEETTLSTARADVRIPSDALIIVPVRNAVIFPGTVAPITIARPSSVAAAAAASASRRIGRIWLRRNRIATISNTVEVPTIQSRKISEFDA